MMDSKIFAAHMVVIYREMRLKKELNQPLTRLRLYRLFFLVALDYYQHTKKILLNEEFVHFKLGPIVREVYSEYSPYYEDQEIIEPARIFIFEEGRFVKLNPLDLEAELDSELRERIRQIFLKYDNCGPFHLTEITFRLIQVEERGTPFICEDFALAKGNVL